MKYASKAKKATLKKQIVMENINHHIDKRDDGHWIWTGSRKKDGYGICVYWDGDKQYCTTAQRRVWQIYKGKIPAGLEVAHNKDCKLRLCVAPDHKHLTSHKGNQREAIEAGTFHFTQHQFTVEQKKEIVSQIVPRSTNCLELAMKYGYTPSHFAHLARGNKTLVKDPDKQEAMAAEYKKSESNLNAIAKEHGVHPQTLYKWRRLLNAEAHQ